MKPTLALDFDDIIFPFMDMLVPFHNEKFGTELTLDDFHTFTFTDVWGGTPQQTLERVNMCLRSLNKDNAEPISGAIDAIDKLQERFELVIVTSREEAMRSVTEEWINAVVPGRFASVFLCGTYVLDGSQVVRTKVEVVEEIDAVALVDDSLKHVSEVAESGRRGYLFGDFPWNRAAVLPANVTRVRDWPALVQELLEAA